MLPVFYDNQAAKAIAELDVDTKRSRHIDIRWHYVRELCQAGVVKVLWCPTAEMLADLLTKPLDQHTMNRLWKLAGCS